MLDRDLTGQHLTPRRVREALSTHHGGEKLGKVLGRGVRGTGRVRLVLPIDPERVEEMIVPNGMVIVEVRAEEEAGTLHPERLEDPRASQLFDTLAGGFLDDQLEEEDPLARVAEAFTRLVDELQAALRREPPPIGEARRVAQSHARRQ